MSSDSARLAALYGRAHQRWLRRQAAATWMAGYCARAWVCQPRLSFKINRRVLRRLNAPVRLPPQRLDGYWEDCFKEWRPRYISYEAVRHLEEQALILLARLAVAAQRGAVCSKFATSKGACQAQGDDPDLAR